MTETYTVDEQEEFVQGLLKLWHQNPELSFGQLVMEVYCALNETFSILSFVRFPMEGWQRSIEGILETQNG